jgi:hemoglobin-like flavoprotein
MEMDKISLVKTSFAQVKEQGDLLPALFYSRLFELEPAIRPLFIHDLAEQGRKLLATLELAVRGLAEPQTIIPAIKQLGRRHVQYGVLDEHYALVGEALIWSLSEVLGEQFTPKVAAAWAEALALLAGLMKEAANESVTA